MKNFLMILLLLISTSLWAESSADLQTLAFQQKVIVHAERVTLGDLFLKEKTSPEIIQRFSGVSLEGIQGGILQASHILDLLSREGLDMDSVALEPPARIEIVFEKEKAEEPQVKKETLKQEVILADTEPKPLMKKGDVVALILTNPSFQIRAVGKVKEVQEQGHRVLVENMDSKKEVWGHAISESEVQIAF